MTIIIYCYGEDYYKNYLTACLQSILDVYGNKINLSIIISNISYSSINDLKRKIPWAKILYGNAITIGAHEDSAAQKINNGWITALKTVKNGEKILFIDADTVLLKKIDNYFEKDFDIGYTYYKDHSTPYGETSFTPNGFNRINTGVMLVKKSIKVVEFFIEYAKLTNEFLINGSPYKKEFGAFDQDALVWFLCNGNLKNISHPKAIYKEIVFFGFKCNELNECESVPLSTNTHIIHYKGGWRKIIPDGDWDSVLKTPREEKNGKEFYNIWFQKYNKWNSS
jgi:hypothetical protein